VKVNQAKFPVQLMCRLLHVSKSGYYAWDERPLCERKRVDMTLIGTIDAIHRRSRGAYGSPNIHAELADDHGIRVGRKRVARLMRAANIQGIRLRRFVITTRRDPAAKPVTDLVERRFYAEAPNRLWVADITYIPTWAGFLYLAAVLDVFSRKAVGWAMATHLRTELVLAALNMAIAQRRARGVIHHADHGCQYTSTAFGNRCVEAGIMPSMGSVGDCYDNAMAESFWATLEREVLSQRCFRTHAEARRAVFEWLEGWYNPHRRHSSLGYRSPMNYERHALKQQAAELKIAPIICRQKSGGTQGQGYAARVAPRVSHAFGFSHHAAQHLPLTRQTGLLLPSDRNPGSRNPRTEQKGIISTPE
jgi:putative transposase